MFSLYNINSMFQPSELFVAGAIVTGVGCFIKFCKLCIYNVRQIEIFGIVIYNSQLLENRIQSISNASSNTLMGVNPMRPQGLLNVV